METERSERARQWLAAHDMSTEGDPDEVARDVMPGIRGDAELSDAEKLELSLGLLDLLDTYWVTVETRWFVNAAAGEAVRDAFWQAIREHLERPRPSEAVLYSLWVDWFEDIETVERAFTETLARDVPALAGATEELLRRAAAVLKVSGPVPWKLKHPVYLEAAAVPRLRPAVFNGLLYSYHDVYGSLEIGPALELLNLLEMPEETERLAELRDELTHGHANVHHRD